jgi:hypothetical protein
MACVIPPDQPIDVAGKPSADPRTPVPASHPLQSVTEMSSTFDSYELATSDATVTQCCIDSGLVLRIDGPASGQIEIRVGGAFRIVERGDTHVYVPDEGPLAVAPAIRIFASTVEVIIATRRGDSRSPLVAMLSSWWTRTRRSRHGNSSRMMARAWCAAWRVHHDVAIVVRTAHGR